MDNNTYATERARILGAFSFLEVLHTDSFFSDTLVKGDITQISDREQTK